ncbi:Sterile alpha motif domain [Trinorchestia longiramus]|nr:Sterile alpha motif domain [Trinorchestia longiramus]
MEFVDEVKCCFTRAAKDGYLKTLSHATKRDCNAPDEAGMTPTAWAAFEGNLEALRLIISRGGDPDKCDNFGNTSLHCAAAKGHMQCVTFLVNFGANVYALDNQYHSPKDLAAIAGKQEVLRFLDSATAKQQAKDPSKVKKIKEKAEKEVEVRLEKSEKMQKKMDKLRETEQKKLEKEREMLEKTEKNGAEEPRRKSFMATISRGSLSLMPRKDSTQLRQNTTSLGYAASPTFSDLTTSASNKKTATSIQKKIFNRKLLQEANSNKGIRDNEFKVREDGGTGGNTVRHLTGLRRDSEIILVPDALISAASDTGSKHAKISDVFDDKEHRPSDATDTIKYQSHSIPDFGDVVPLKPKGSIFDRPGFGSVAFRNTISGTFSGLGSVMPGIGDFDEEDEDEDEEKSLQPQKRVGRDGLGSAGSLHHDSSSPFEEEDLPSDDETETSPLFLYLAGLGLVQYINTFTDNHVDLEALKLLTEEDLKELGLPLGPRRKLLFNTREHREKNAAAVTVAAAVPAKNEEENTSL